MQSSVYAIMQFITPNSLEHRFSNQIEVEAGSVVLVKILAMT